MIRCCSPAAFRRERDDARCGCSPDSLPSDNREEKEVERGVKVVLVVVERLSSSCSSLATASTATRGDSASLSVSISPSSSSSHRHRHRHHHHRRGRRERYLVPLRQEYDAVLDHTQTPLHHHRHHRRRHRRLGSRCDGDRGQRGVCDTPTTRPVRRRDRRRPTASQADQSPRSAAPGAVAPSRRRSPR